MLTDIEIAQSVEMKPITEIAKAAHVDEKYIEQYGKYKAKIDLLLLLIIVISSLGLGYAYLNTTLNINGTLDIDSNIYGHEEVKELLSIRFSLFLINFLCVFFYFLINFYI